MKYKVGNQVRVKSRLTIGTMYGKLKFTKNMNFLKGKSFLVDETQGIGSEYQVFGLGYWLSEGMLEPVPASSKFKLFTKSEVSKIVKDSEREAKIELLKSLELRVSDIYSKGTEQDDFYADDLKNHIDWILEEELNKLNKEDS